MDYTYLTGRKDLFEGAPERAMCVLEHVDDDRIFYATAHELGAIYWNADGSDGLKTGLIALVKKTRVLATRVLTGVDPRKPQPVPSAGKMERMKQAQNSARTAMRKPKIEPEVEPEYKAVDDGHGHGNMVAVRMRDLSPSALAVEHLKAEQVKPTPTATGGFVSLFALAKLHAPTFLTVGRNNNLRFARTVAVEGDLVDLQADFDRSLVRLVFTKEGRKVNKNSQMTSAQVCKLFAIPEGQPSVTIPLEMVDGYWQGSAEFVKAGA